jgi:hypothetical protein
MSLAVGWLDIQRTKSAPRQIPFYGVKKESRRLMPIKRLRKTLMKRLKMPTSDDVMYNYRSMTCTLRAKALVFDIVVRTVRIISSLAYAVTAFIPSTPAGAGGGAGISNLVFSAIIRWKPMPTPSITARRIAQPMAPLRTALNPPLIARLPPVKPPAMMAFQGSSFFLLSALVDCIHVSRRVRMIKRTVCLLPRSQRWRRDRPRHQNYLQGQASEL